MVFAIAVANLLSGVPVTLCRVWCNRAVAGWQRTAGPRHQPRLGPQVQQQGGLNSVLNVYIIAAIVWCMIALWVGLAALWLYVRMLRCT